MNLSVLFQEMQTKKIHMAIVIDEYSQTEGIVSMEDMLEVIVGNILDEYDVEDRNITKIDGQIFILYEEVRDWKNLRIH